MLPCSCVIQNERLGQKNENNKKRKHFCHFANKQEGDARENALPREEISAARQSNPRPRSNRGR